jgi:tRNA1Val (adenine37-N6)-methyltransferase
MREKMELKENERIDDLGDGLKIIQNKKWFCFGQDAVLLANFVKGVKKGDTVLDLGTGTGIIPILLTAKTEAKKVTGIEIQEEVAKMAARSVEMNNLSEKIEIVYGNFCEYYNKKNREPFDIIVTNPPYKKNNCGIHNMTENKLISRHEVACNLEQVLQIAYKNLKEQGLFFMVHRAERLADIMEQLRKNKLEPKEVRFVYSNIESEAQLVLIQAKKNAGSFLKIQKPLFIYDN